MQFGAADAIDLGTAFRAGPENDSAAALVETGGGILDLTLSLTLYTIAFHLKPPNSNGLLESISSFFYQYTRKILSLITVYSKSIHDVLKKSRGRREFYSLFKPKNDV